MPAACSGITARIRATRPEVTIPQDFYSRLAQNVSMSTSEGIYALGYFLGAQWRLIDPGHVQSKLEGDTWESARMSSMNPIQLKAVENCRYAAARFR